MSARVTPDFEEVERSADPAAAQLLLARLSEGDAAAAERVAADGNLRAALIALAGASPWLARLCVTDPAALDVLSFLDQPVDVAALSGDDGYQIAHAKQLSILRIAARDLLGLDTLESVGASLSRVATDVLRLAWSVTGKSSRHLSVIGMGKLGGSELNYSSDIDVLLVAGGDGSHAPDVPDARHLLQVARRAWKVDASLRPEGRAGPLVRTLDSYGAYWDRWAQTWEFQALIKARAVAGDHELGARFEEEAAERIWSRAYGADELRQVRYLKGRAEEVVSRRGLSGRELKTGKGGIRDIEFAVQLLQLVHGRADSALRSPSTLPALRALASGGYVGTTDAELLEEAYVFLRTVEHRLQLRENEQVHALPATKDAMTRLARVLGYRNRADSTALAGFEADLRRHQATVRSIHERLFFRPLLEAFSSVALGRVATSRHGAGSAAAHELASGRDLTALDRAGGALTSNAIADRLHAFGFADAARTRQAIQELTRGFTRASQLMQQMLPVMLDWLSVSPDPDLGLLGLRTLASSPHCRDQLIALCRESPEAARQLCLLLGTGPQFAKQFQRHPDMLAELAGKELLDDRSKAELLTRARRMLAWRSGEKAVQQGLRLFGRAEMLRVAVRDVLGFADVVQTAGALTDLAEAVIEVAFDHADPQVPMAVIGMGRLGGRELAYASDLDLLFVYDIPEGTEPADAAMSAEAAASALVRLIGGSTPASGLYHVDTALRPEGRQGPQARSLDAYVAYYKRWAQVWERQALLRGRFVAGDTEVGRRFEEIVTPFVWARPITAEEIREIRRTKARVERERVPASEDPTFHLKLGPGALTDVEWTAQLLQLQHGVPTTGTVDALDLLSERGVLSEGDEQVLAEAYRFCEQTRNRLGLVRDVPSDSLPTAGPQLTALARSLGTTPTGLRDDYRRFTRRCRRVVEQLFYGRST